MFLFLCSKWFWKVWTSYSHDTGQLWIKSNINKLKQLKCKVNDIVSSNQRKMRRKKRRNISEKIIMKKSTIHWRVYLNNTRKIEIEKIQRWGKRRHLYWWRVVQHDFYKRASILYRKHCTISTLVVAFFFHLFFNSVLVFVVVVFLFFPLYWNGWTFLYLHFIILVLFKIRSFFLSFSQY